MRALFMMMYSLHLKYLETGDKFKFVVVERGSHTRIILVTGIRSTACQQLHGGQWIDAHCGFDIRLFHNLISL